MSEYSYAPRHRTREPEYVTETTYIERGGRTGGARDLVYRPAAREDSIEEIPRDFPPGAEYRQTKYREEYAPPRRTRSVNRGYDDDYYDRPRRRDRDYDDRSEYSERPNMQRRKSIVDKVKDFGESAGLGGIIGAVTGSGRDRSRSRPRRDDRGYDSDRHGYYDDRDRRSSRYASRSRSRSRGGRKSEKWEQAAKAAIVAGAVEAFRSRKEAGPWTGAKGQRIATAALGAAGIDGLIDRDPGKHEKRHVAESALGGLVASRLANGSRSRSRAPRGRDDSRSRSRSRSRARSRSRSIFGRSRSRGRSRSHSSEGGNGLAKVAGTGAVLAAGKALYDRVRSKSRSRRERSRSSSADSYVPSRRGNRRSYSRGRGMDDQYSEAPSRTNPDRRLAAAGGAGAGALTAQGGGADRGRWDASSDSESSTDMEEKRKKLRAANQSYPTSYADANPYGSSVPPPPMGARY
ncbi:hypothetical protein ACET3X_009711 [Alternaria dauci]|uniref:DUF3824 domain-containing protein n=1 Tax=Alternaria dauci TaxID=48095 RepID=A0ABR3U7L3_9PLEO